VTGLDDTAGEQVINTLLGHSHCKQHRRVNIEKQQAAAETIMRESAL
jgi:hypothetical protein